MVHLLAKKQAENGHKVALMAGRPSEIPGVDDNSFVKGRPYSEKKFIMNRVLTTYSLRAILKSRKHNFDIIHNHISEEAISFSILANTNFITTLHCPMTLQTFWPFLTTSISGFLPKKTKFVSISRRSFEAYKRFYGNNLMRYIHNGIDISNIPFNLKPTKDHELQIGFLGKFTYHKQPQAAVKIADILHEWKYDVKLFLVGKLDFPLSGYSEELCRMAKQREHVALYPNATNADVHDIVGNCDVLLCTSYELGVPVSNLEALALGVPVVGFTDGCAAEIVVEGRNGYLGYDLHDAAKKCLLALSLEREECRHFAHERETKMYEGYMQAYDDVLACMLEESV